MANPHVVSALMEKRAEIAGQVERAAAALRNLRVSLAHIDGTLRLYEPTIDPMTIKPKRGYARSQILPGMYWRVLDVLRGAASPMTTREIARELIALHSLDPLVTLEKLDSGISAYLGRQDGKLEERMDWNKRPNRWRVLGG